MMIPRVQGPWAPVLAAVLAAALAAGALVWSNAAPSTPLAGVSTAAVLRGDIEEVVTALGTLQPSEFVDVGTQVSGQLRHLSVAVGDTVKAGAVVAEIDTAVLGAKLQADQALMQGLDAQIQEKQAQLALAHRQHQRSQTLLAENMVSRAALDTTQAAVQVAAAQVASLKAQREQTRAALRIAEAQLGYAKIRAPIAGTVVSLAAREGQTLNASQQAPTLLRIARLDTMTVVAQVSEADVTRLAVATPVHFHTLGRPDRRWRGRVRQILPTPETVNNVVLYPVLFDVDNADRSLMTQMSAQVSFVLAQAKDALLVPAAALDAPPRRASAPAPDDGPAPATASAAGTGAAPLGAGTGAVPPGAGSGATSPGAGSGAVPPGAGIGAAPAPTVRTVSVLGPHGDVQARRVVVGLVTRRHAQVISGLAEGDRVVLPHAAPRGGDRDERQRAQP